jgi:hypothetical protein
MGKAPKKLSAAKSEKLDIIIDTFISEKKSAFSIADLKNAPPIAEDPLFVQVTEEELFARVRRNSEVFSKDGQTFKSRRSFFKKARFLIVPTEEEVREKIVIPGHRFFPFQSTGIAPWECTLVPGPSGSGEKAIPTKVITRKTATLYVYFSLLGLENMPSFLAANHEENAGRYQESETMDNAMMKITVFDFSDFFDARGFVFRDALVCTVQDWTAGMYTLEYLPREEYQKFETEQWIGDLERGFKKTFDLFGLKIPIEEQIAQGYFFAGTSVLKNPPMSFGGFINASKKVHVVNFGMDTYLWPKKEIEFEDLETLTEEQDDADLSPIDSILKSNELPFSELIIEACMADELFRSKGSADNPDTVMNRLFNFDEMPFNTAGDEKKFKKCFNDLWKKARGSYNYFADQRSGEIRSDILNILEQYYKWLDTLPAIGWNLGLEDFPVQIFADLMQMAESLTRMLAAIKEDPQDISNATAMKKQLSVVRASMEDLQEKITERGRQTKPTSLRVVKSGSAEKVGESQKKKSGQAAGGKSGQGQPEFDIFRTPVPSEPAGGGLEKVYILEISLEGISPRIWRQLRIPGSFTLGDLHGAIQIAMGWENDHLHSFTLGSVTYGMSAETAAEYDMEEEDEYALDFLGLRKKQKFSYLYDFGDTWEHRIVVSDILTAGEKDSGYPECLGGERACPPEDCGGAWGYEEILTALEEHDPDKHQEQLKWFGKYDPEHFDLKAVNRSLKRRFK